MTDQSTRARAALYSDDNPPSPAAEQLLSPTLATLHRKDDAELLVAATRMLLALTTHSPRARTLVARYRESYARDAARALASPRSAAATAPAPAARLRRCAARGRARGRRRRRRAATRIGRALAAHDDCELGRRATRLARAAREVADAAAAALRPARRRPRHAAAAAGRARPRTRRACSRMSRIASAAAYPRAAAQSCGIARPSQASRRRARRARCADARARESATTTRASEHPRAPSRCVVSPLFCFSRGSIRTSRAPFPPH